WLKVHYTAEFFCGNMTVEMDNTDKLKVLVEDARKMGMDFAPPDVNRGVHRFVPVSDRLIRYGLGAVKGTGELAIEAIVAAREGRGEGPNGHEKGPFTSLFDFCLRVDRQRINKRTVEALIKAGAFDSLHLNRAELLASVDLAFEYAATTQANAHQGGLFDLMGEDSHGSSTQEPALVATTPWGVKERLTHEKTAIGFYFSGHLFDEVRQEVRRFVRTELVDVAETRDPVVLAGIVSELRVINGQRGRIAFFKLDDGTAVLEVSADEGLIQQHRHALRDDELLIVQATVQPDRFSGGLRVKVQQMWDLAAARCRFGKYLRVAVNGHPPEVARLVGEFPPQRESTEQGERVRGLPVRLALQRQGACCELQLDDRALFYPTDAALASWMAQADGQRAEIVFD
ncbi:MAG: DNA polymerase III subunit alpha, partial [Burkholderiales bacterium]